MADIRPEAQKADETNGMDENTVPWPSAYQGWFIVAIFFVAAIVSYTDRMIFSLIVDPVRRSLGISDFEVGLAQGTTFALIYALAGLPSGRLADVANRRNLLLMGTFVWSAGTVACGLATGIKSLMAARIFVAGGEALLAPTAISMISDLFPPRRRGRPMAVFLSGMNVGSGLALVIGGGMLSLAQAGAFNFAGFSQLAPWRTTLVLIGLLGLPVLLLLMLIREPARRTDHEQQRRPFKLVLRELLALWKRLLPLFAALAGLATVDFAVISWLPTLLSRDFVLPTSTISNVFGTVVLVTGFMGTLVGGWAADHFFIRGGNGLRLRLAALLALTGAITVGCLVAASAEIAIALSGIWLFASAIATVCGISTAQDVVPADAKGLCISCIAMGNISFGLGVGAALPGGLAGMTAGLSWALAMVAMPAALIAGVLFLAASRFPAEQARAFVANVK